MDTTDSSESQTPNPIPDLWRQGGPASRGSQMPARPAAGVWRSRSDPRIPDPRFQFPDRHLADAKPSSKPKAKSKERDEAETTPTDRRIFADNPSVRPLLKWAGGKRQLLPALEPYYPRSFDRYLEPFVGSGAVFFHLAATGVLDGRVVMLSDVNADLIGCYRTVRDRTEDVIDALHDLERDHRRRGDACYYEVRDRRFNPARAKLAAAGSDRAATGYSPALAAMLIFLNRTGFNGLFRLNRGGGFNVPAGRYKDPRICDPDHIRTVADVLRRPGLAIEHRGFEEALGSAGRGDFVYCDPPYAPLSRTSSFAGYTAAGFAAMDQQRLRQAVVQACRRGAQVVMSNSSAPEIESAYQTPAARQVKIAVHRVPARRAINSRASSRGPVDELIITNVPGPQSHAIERLRGTRPTMVKASGPRNQPVHRIG